MNKIRVGIDVDGVLRDFVGKTIDKAREHGVYMSRPKNYDYIDNYYIDGKSLRHHIWGSEEWLIEIFEDSDVLPFARKGYDKFCENGKFEVHIVTAQKEGTEHYTQNWLDDNGFDKHQNTYYELEKLNSPVQILIDDKPANVKEYAENLREGYLVDCSYNLDSNFKPRVGNLYEAYEKLTEKYGKGNEVRSEETKNGFSTT